MMLQSTSEIILEVLMFFLMLLARTLLRHINPLATLTMQTKFWLPT